MKEILRLSADFCSLEFHRVQSRGQVSEYLQSEQRSVGVSSTNLYLCNTQITFYIQRLKYIEKVSECGAQ